MELATLSDPGAAAHLAGWAGALLAAWVLVGLLLLLRRVPGPVLLVAALAMGPAAALHQGELRADVLSDLARAPAELVAGPLEKVADELAARLDIET